MNTFKTKYVTKPWGEQLKFAEDNPNIKFAVPPSEENINDNVNVVDEIMEEIMNYLDDIINETSDFRSRNMDLDDIIAKTVNSTILKIKSAIEGIFDNYSK